MPVTKGGVWTNIEDEILKAAISKYGLNQWARVSSLLARKTAKQCKSRWTEWLDPGIKKIEWSKEEDEKLLHLAKLMPTQWRTIAPIIGRTANQCLERYQKLLDDAELRENDDLGLSGVGAEAAAPTGDDVRKLRPGELDPDPESRPARPDTIDLDEDEKEMLSEARARLANTQGKKAKRKARERQLEESRRLAVLQKRRELKQSGINMKITNRKKGQMDYNADIPFEKKAAAGFYDTQEEQVENDKEKEAFDPRKQQLARKRQGDPEDSQDPKRQKQDKDKAADLAAARAGQMQRLREAEQRGKRRALNLPAPQVSEAELEDIVKMGMSGEKAVKAAGDEDDARGLVQNYTNMVGATPIRTPRAPVQEDHIANEIRNIRALNDTQSSLLGGENTPLHTGSASTGFESVTPRRQQLVTPNPMATPYRQSGPNGQPPGATPMRTPRDNFAINELGEQQLVSQTPRDLRTAEHAKRQSLRAKLSSLPKPKAIELEIEGDALKEQAEDHPVDSTTRIDQEEIDRQQREERQAAAAAEFKRQSQAYQRSLPRPRSVDYISLHQAAQSTSDPIQALIAEQAALLIAHDAKHHPLPGTKIAGKQPPGLETIDDAVMAKARAELETELDETSRQEYHSNLTETYFDLLDDATYSSKLPFTLSSTEHTTAPLSSSSSSSSSSFSSAFTTTSTSLLSTAQANNALEKKLHLHLGGYISRSKTLKTKITETYKTLEDAKVQLESFRLLGANEDVGVGLRLEGSRGDVGVVSRREREEQDVYRGILEEVRGLDVKIAAAAGGAAGKVNGVT